MQAFANGDKARQWTGTLPELVEKLEEWGVRRFCTPEEMFSHDEGRFMTAWKWFTDKPSMCYNEAGEHPEDMREFEPLDNPRPAWRHVQPLAVTPRMCASSLNVSCGGRILLMIGAWSWSRSNSG